MPTMRDRFVSVVTELLDTDLRVALVLADIGVSRFRESGALRRHPDRVVNVGIREQLQIGVAAGLALEGFRPFVHTYAPFLVERPFEQLKLDLGHQDVGSVLVSVGASYDAAHEGRTHQAPGDVALISTLPDWKVCVPGHPDEAEAALRRAAREPGRTYIRLAEDVNRRPHAPDDGRLVVVRRGGSQAVVVLAIGPMLDRVLEATAGMDATVVYGARPRPFDHRGLAQVAGSGDVVLVEPYLRGTSTAEVSRALSATPHRLLDIGVPRSELRRYGTRAEHERAHGLDAPGIARRIAVFAEARRTA